MISHSKKGKKLYFDKKTITKSNDIERRKKI